MALARIRSLIQRLMAQDQSPHKLALTCALGVFIGICPLIGLHTVMTIALGWLFSLSIPALFAVSVLIHNPWTMIPVYAFDHLFGMWLFNYFCVDYTQLDPIWMESCKGMLKQYTGISGLSFAAFFIGGNLLAIALSMMIYLLSKRFFIVYLSQKSINNKISA